MRARVLLISYYYMGVLYIDELLRAGDEIVGVVNWPGNTGFNQGWYVPPEYDVRAKALRNYLPLYEPDPAKLNSPEFVEILCKLSPDFIVSGYYSKIFRKPLLSIPPGGCVNIHPTGLPRYRGLSPYFTHMLFGDTHNYITLHWLDPGVDTGDIIGQASIEIRDDDTGYSSGHRLTEAGAALFRENWPKIKAHEAPHLDQDETQASTFNFSWDMAEINWQQSSLRIWNLVRALTKPLGGAWTLLGGQKLHVWSSKIVQPAAEIKAKVKQPGEILALTGTGLWVQCGEGQLQLTDIGFEDPSIGSPPEFLGSLMNKLPILLG